MDREELNELVDSAYGKLGLDGEDMLVRLLNDYFATIDVLDGILTDRPPDGVEPEEGFKLDRKAILDRLMALRYRLVKG